MRINTNTLMLPFFDDADYLSMVPEKSILFGRFKDDYLSPTLLFQNGYHLRRNNVRTIQQNSCIACYVYDTFDLENREYTLEGFQKINRDIRMIIDSGFSHILVSNPYLIELLTNEYEQEIKVIVSAQLEINSARGHIFFDVLNSRSSISHIVISQNHLNIIKLNTIFKKFSDFGIILELDRVASNNQIVHEHYYNMLYGYSNYYVENEISKFLDKNKPHIKHTKELYFPGKEITYKIGELFSDIHIVKSNLSAFARNKIDEIVNIDLDFWDLKKRQINNFFRAVS